MDHHVATPEQWDAMSRELRVLAWTEYWLRYWEQRGGYHVRADEPTVLSEGIVALLEEVRKPKLKESRAPYPLSPRRRNPRLGEDIGQPIC